MQSFLEQKVSSSLTNRNIDKNSAEDIYNSIKDVFSGKKKNNVDQLSSPRATRRGTLGPNS